jgi:hypothetical protein
MVGTLGNAWPNGGDATQYIVSPTQAANTFTQIGGFARQKNVFIVRFVTTTTGPIMSNFSNLTFAVKSVDRPKVNLKTEELNEYNKIRVVHTGRKLEPIKMQLYDSADGAVQNMFAAYCGYYFGDLMNQGIIGNTNNSYQYDATSSLFADFAGSGFGFTGKNGLLGSLNTNISAIDTLTADAQWFFDRIEVYHFYDGLFDLYCYTHPRIENFDLSELDYSSADVSTINMMFKYEQLQYYPQNQVAGFDFPEFQNQFNGNPLDVTTIPFPATQPIQPQQIANPNDINIVSLLSSTAALSGITNIVNNYNYSSAPSTGGIGIFGSFNFGPATNGNGNTAADLSTLSLGNPALTTALNLGSNVLTTGSGGVSPVFTQAQATGGLNPALYPATAAKVAGVSSGYGSGSTIVTTGLAAANAINGTSANVNASGQITLPLSAYGTINSLAQGTAQYGFNPIT